MQPSRRPADGRYGENPNRLYKHHQFQVILKPSPADIQDAVPGQPRCALGIDPAAHDVRFEEDNWESPTLGAWGIGWQVLLDGQEITQFTYFQQAGGIDLAPISAEITYGLERIAMYLQDKDDVYDIEWSPGVPYGRVRKEEEYQLSRYSFEQADVALYRTALRQHVAEGWRVLGLAGGRTVLAAYDWALKSSHAFNVLDARGAISVSQRAGMILGIRKLACAIAAAYVAPPEGQAPAAGEATRELRCSSRSAAKRSRPPGSPGSTEQVRQRFTEIASRELLEPRTSWPSATPRRLVLKATVVARQPDRDEKVWGPQPEASPRIPPANGRARRRASRRRTASPPMRCTRRPRTARRKAS